MGGKGMDKAVYLLVFGGKLFLQLGDGAILLGDEQFHRLYIYM